MSIKTIKKIIPAERVNMGGNLLDQPLPARDVEYIDPFILIHHWNNTMPGGQRQQDVGVGPHPHRGFSPVTFIYKGSFQHRDSLGNIEIVTEGGTQWMFAGKGITHSERPGKLLAEQGGQSELIQFWVNAPAKVKMEPAFYKPISKENTPTITDSQSSIQVVCGNYENTEGAVIYYSPLLLLRIELKALGELNLKVDKSHNTIIYLLDGNLKLGSNSAKAKDLVWFNNNGDEIEILAAEKTRFIVLSGESINEPISTYGPFVMNTQTEIMEAIRDSQTGKLGILIEEF